MSQRTALTRIEVVLVIVIVALLVSILIPSLSRARELKKREKCANNAKGIATGLYTAASESSADWWEVDWPPRNQYRNRSDWAVEYTRAVGSYRSTDLSQSTILPERISTTRGLWMLVRSGASTPNQFICPSSFDSVNTEAHPNLTFDFGLGDIKGPVSDEQAAQFWHQVSYGYQVPFGKFGQPSSDRDQRMILMADKGPFGANVDAGFAAPPAFPATGDPSDWRPWNSPNHGGLGQTALFADSHADFLRTPLTPGTSDNIYTRWTVTGQGSAQSRGLAPAPGLKLHPVSQTDSLIYP